jgi:membrane protease YdiL (CAAX protease family)
MATTAFYTGMVALAWLISYLRQAPLAGSHLGTNWGIQIASGAGTGGALAALWWLLAQRFSGAAALERTLQQAVGRPSITDALWLAAVSGIGEELLFRGALQPWWGLWFTSALFGLIHGGGTKGLRWWTLGACVAGLVFGGLREHFGSVLAPTVAHFVVNAIGLWRMGRGQH